MTDAVAAPVDELANARKRMGAGLVSMGVLHVVAPEPFHKIIPEQLGNPKLWNLVAAGAEITAGALLLTADPSLRRAGGWLALGTILGVYPANIDMAIKAGAPTNPKAIAAWARLPMQFPMIRTAYRLARA